MRRTVRRENVGVALFPFLAVLICTMGSLIVLLVLLVQQARLDARSVADAKAGAASAVAESDQQLRQQLEDANFRRELLEQSRTQTAEQLAEGRARLAHLEDHFRRLQARARELMERARNIDEGKQLKGAELAAAQAELERLQAEITVKQKQLDEARKKQTDAEQWFALILYDGPNRTRRRPIYLECTVSGVVIQPEGLILSPEDFDGPLGPGNPLDAALRTIREHISRTAGDKAGDPYPLLVVRPSGVVTFNYARLALKSWDDEFGYELIEDDKKLVFGDPDPALAGSLKQSVAIARQRQAAMIAMMPRRYQSDEPLTSFAPEPPSEQGGNSFVSRPGRGIGQGEGGYRSGDTPGNGNGGTGGSLLAGPTGAAAFSRSNGQGNGGAPGAPTAGQSSGATAAGPYGQPGTAAGGQPGGQFSGQPGGSSSGQVSGPAGAQTSQTAGSGSESGSSSGSPSSGQTAGQAGDPSAQQGQAGAPSASMQFGAPPSAPPPPGSNARSGKSKSGKGSVPSGATRGNNWALKGADRHATAITRPIYVAVLADRFVLVPEKGDSRAPQHLRVSPDMTAAEADAFVAAVQREMKSWGLAVDNGYWKPVLNVEVADDAEHQFDSLRIALEGSGFEVIRKALP